MCRIGLFCQIVLPTSSGKDVLQRVSRAEVAAGWNRYCFAWETRFLDGESPHAITIYKARPESRILGTIAVLPKRIQPTE